MGSAGIPEPGGSGNPANLFKSSPFLGAQSSNGSKTQDQSCVLKSSRLLPLLWHWRKCNGSALISSYNKPSTFRKFIPLTAVCDCHGRTPYQTQQSELNRTFQPSWAGEIKMPLMLKTPETERNWKRCALQTPARNILFSCREMCKTLLEPHW